MTNQPPTAPTSTANEPRGTRTLRILDAYDLLMHRLVSSHLPEFMEVAVTMSQAKVLYTVLAAGSLRMSELAARLGVSLSTTSGQVERLVESGLLDRHDDPADRRQVVVQVTAEGEAILGRFRELNNEQLRHLLDRLDDASLRIVEDAVAILAEAARPSADDPTATLAGSPPFSIDRKDTAL